MAAKKKPNLDALIEAKLAKMLGGKQAISTKPADAKNLQWWRDAQPLLHRAWLLHQNGAGSKAKDSVVKSIAEFYAQSHKNLHGSEPDPTPQRQYPPGWD